MSKSPLSLGSDFLNLLKRWSQNSEFDFFAPQDPKALLQSFRLIPCSFPSATPCRHTLPFEKLHPHDIYAAKVYEAYTFTNPTYSLWPSFLFFAARLTTDSDDIPLHAFFKFHRS